MIKTITINGKSIGSGYLTQIGEVGGFEAPTVQNNTYYISGDHGAKTPNSYWRERNIILSLLVRANSLASFRLERDAIFKAFGIPSVGQSTMSFTTNDNLLLQTDVQLVSMTGPFKSSYLGYELRIELIASDPYLLGQTENETTVYLPTGSGTAIPTVIPLSLAYLIGGTEDITISGSGYFYPTITINGPVENPIIKNYTTGKELQVEEVLTGNDHLAIDMKNQTVVLNNSLNYLDFTDGDFWRLAPGVNKVGLSSVTYDVNASAVITWRNAYLGV